VFPGAPFCQPCGHERFYSASQVLNCPFDCSYCYLKGKYPGANIVVFVNTGDYLDEVSGHIGTGGAMMALSYDSDEAALEPLLGILDEWYPFIEKNNGTTFEIRTKSCFIPACDPMPNFVTAFSVLPEKVISAYESGTPPLSARLEAALELLKKGYKVRLCIDPVLPVDNAPGTYADFTRKLACKIDLGSLEGVTLGGFRMTSACRRAVQKLYGDHFIHFYPMEAKGGVARLPLEYERPVIEAVRDVLKKYLAPGRIFTL
jgi:spore photoproduct lyase